MIRPDKIDRLKSQLLTSGLSQKDSPLYQVINQLIGVVKDVITDVNGGSGSGGGGGGGSTVNNISNITQYIDYGSDAISDDSAVFISSVPSSTVTGSNHYDCPLSDGDLVAADLIYAAGECIIVQVPV